MLITFHGPRPEPKFNPKTGKIEKFEGDHKNGNKYNNRPDNLEWVFESENSWRYYHVLRIMRTKGIDPTTYTGPQMDIWFAMFRHLESVFTVVYHWQTFQKDDYLRWFSMPFEDFKSDLARHLGPLLGPEQMMKESFYDRD